MAHRHPVIAYQSTGPRRSRSARNGKLHLDIACTGLAHVPISPAPASRLAVVEYASLRTLASDPNSRPCRMCALETVLDSILGPSNRSRRVFASFTSQPALCADATRFHANDVSDTGRARLQRIADRLGLATCFTPAGPAAYGMLPSSGVKLLARNLRTIVRPDLADVPDSRFMSTLWTLLQDAPPELGHGTRPRLDPWEATTLLTARITDNS